MSPVNESTMGTLLIWQHIAQIATGDGTIEDIRGVIREAGIPSGAHQGTDPDTFTRIMVAEWLLGQWANLFDRHGPGEPDGIFAAMSMLNMSRLWWERAEGERMLADPSLLAELMPV